MSKKVGIVAGVTGIVGLNLANRLLSDGWKVYGISRRKPSYLPEAIQHVAIDFTNAAQCKTELGRLKDATHVFVTTWVNAGSEVDNCRVNEEVMVNIVDNMSSSVKHVVLVTGTKNYFGSFEQYGNMKAQTQSDLNPLLPFKEDQARQPTPNFYYNQEDVLFDRSKKRGFNWYVLRPSAIVGFAPFNQMNIGTSLAVYATICKHLDLPFTFPSGVVAYDVFVDVSDADLIASQIVWAVNEPKAANQAMNCVNGDVFCWRQMWQKIAEYFDVKTEEPNEIIDLEKMMADKGPVWGEIVKKYNLQPFKLKELTSWWFVNTFGRVTLNAFSSTSKTRKLGFMEYQDTEECHTKLFDYLRKNRYIP